ncbi:hypothetical protein AM501_05690 [Aneurinibacillus migulanus]|nr:hypothetical protein AM501_05690 [Aneurinibacillus migulanus]
MPIPAGVLISWQIRVCIECEINPLSGLPERFFAFRVPGPYAWRSWTEPLYAQQLKINRYGIKRGNRR